MDTRRGRNTSTYSSRVFRDTPFACFLMNIRASSSANPKVLASAAYVMRKLKSPSENLHATQGHDEGDMGSTIRCRIPVLRDTLVTSFLINMHANTGKDTMPEPA